MLVCGLYLSLVVLCIYWISLILVFVYRRSLWTRWGNWLDSLLRRQGTSFKKINATESRRSMQLKRLQASQSTKNKHVHDAGWLLDKESCNLNNNSSLSIRMFLRLLATAECLNNNKILVILVLKGMFGLDQRKKIFWSA